MIYLSNNESFWILPRDTHLLSLNTCMTSPCCVLAVCCCSNIFTVFTSDPSFSTSGWDGRDDEQHKGRRRVSDRRGTAVHPWPLQEIFHSTLQEPSDQWKGSHTPDPAEHSQGDYRLGRSKVNHCDTVIKTPRRHHWYNILYILEEKSCLLVLSTKATNPTCYQVPLW